MEKKSEDLLTETRSSSSSSRQPSYRRIISKPSILFLWIAQTISQSGDYVFNVAILWYVLTSTGSVFYVGVAQAVIAVPAIVVGPVAGVYVDRLNRRNVMLASVVSQGGVTALISLLFVSNALTLDALFLLVFVLFSCAQFFTAAVNGYIPNAVSAEDLTTANSLFSLSSLSNKLAGYSVGGLVVSLIGVVVPVVYDSYSFFAAAVVLLLVSSANGVVAKRKKTAITSNGIVVVERDEGAGSGFFQDFKQGIDYIASSRELLEFVFVGFVLTFFAGGLITLLAPYAQDSLGGNASTYGFLLGSAVVGGGVGSLIFGRMKSARKKIGRIFAFCVLGSGLAVVAMGLTQNALLAVVFGTLLGGTYFVATLCVQVILQAKVPSSLNARVYTVFVSLLSIAAPISAFTAGVLATYLSIGTIFIIFGLCVAIVAGTIFVGFKELRSSSY